MTSGADRPEQANQTSILGKIMGTALLIFVISATLTLRAKCEEGECFKFAGTNEETSSPVTLYTNAGDAAAISGDKAKALSYYTEAARLSLKELERGEPYYCLLHKELADGHEVAISRCMATQQLCLKIEEQLGNDLIRGCVVG
jgi:hypothetical protein